MPDARASTTRPAGPSHRLARRMPPFPVSTAAICLAAFALGGCGTLYQDSSPDVAYSRDAAAARALQVPPDLTDVSDGEQFVLPGSDGGPLTRDTLLPVFEGVRFVREGAATWLAFDTVPEELWPRLLDFARHEKYRIDATEPTAGTIFTQWRPASAVGGGSLLGNLIRGEDFTRLGFRLERAGEAGARLFARTQSADEDVVEAERELPWEGGASDPEESAALLARLLVFLGVEAQRAAGVIDQARASSVLDEAALSSGPSGNLLVVNRGFEPAFRAVGEALAALEHEVTSSDDGVGRIEYLDEGTPYVLTLVPLHVGAVRVALGDADGRPLEAERERDALEALRAAMLA